MIQEEKREDYLFEKKCLLVLLCLYYLNDVSYDGIVLRSFGFHFDPRCNYKVIVTSKKQHIHKYTVHIHQRKHGVNLESLDEMGNVNFVRVSDIAREYDPYFPSAGLTIYFDGDSFLALGYIEGKKIELRSEQGEEGRYSSLIDKLNSIKAENESAPNFLLWLMRLYACKLPLDLVIGAGINKDYGAKDWKELISTLSASYYGSSSKKADEMKRYVGEELFTSPVLMKNSGYKLYEELNHELYEFKEAKTFSDPDSTLYKCVDFLSAHPGTSVITYNYDTNLEYLLKKRGLLYCTIYDDTSFVTKNAVTSIYHVHGLLPYGKYEEERFTSSIVFGESDYFALYNNPYSWNIAKQLHDFKFNACIFIGISLTDPDMKRILQLASNYLKFNFIFMKKEKGFSQKVFRDVSAYFFSFDLIVVWVSEYEEIGTWLAKL